MEKRKNSNCIMPDDNKSCSYFESENFERIHSQGNNMSDKVYEYTKYSINVDVSRKRKKKMFIMLAVLVIILISLLSFSAIKIIIDSKAKNSSQSNNLIQQEEIAFSFGNISGNIYQNKWADIKFALENNWEQAPKEKYNFFEDKNATCDFNALSDDKSQISVLLIDLSRKESLLLLSEDELVKEFSAGISKKLDEPIVSETQYQMIGNQVYLYSDVTGKTDGKEICISSFLRKKDDYVIVINVSSVNSEKNHNISEKIESCE